MGTHRAGHRHLIWADRRRPRRADRGCPRQDDVPHRSLLSSPGRRPAQVSVVLSGTMPSMPPTSPAWCAAHQPSAIITAVLAGLVAAVDKIARRPRPRQHIVSDIRRQSD
ncbi:hypothetical protein ACP4OV_027779 [Aristida adscensionis]